jgi:GTP-binding protein
MAKKKRLPLVAICGRPNAGKSTLFNRLTGRQTAIIHSEVGVTRDRAIGTVEWNEHTFRLVDTGGIVEKPTDSITHKMQDQVRQALKDADVIVFLADGQEEITRTEEEIRNELFKLSKPIVLAVNKLDNYELEMNRMEFYSLGVGDPIAISSGHNLGIEDLLSAIVAHLPEPSELPDEEEERDITKVAIIGKPNVGKSSFINALLNEERTIVDDTPGTTRDAIDIEFRWEDKDYLIIDTAGMRKKAGIKKHVERFSVSRSLRTIRRADVCLVMIDATEGIAEQDKRIVNFVRESGTAMILVWTKWDLIEDKEERYKAIADEIDLKAPFLKYVPYLTVSNLTRQRLLKAFDYIDRVAAQAKRRIGTGELNRFIETKIKSRGLPAQHRGSQAKIRYATQASIKPTTFVLFINQKKLFHFSYLRFIENQLREEYGLEGVPINLELRQEKPRK